MTFKKANWFGNSNIKGYLFFLLFTTIVAIFIKLANTYTTNNDFRVVLTDVPDDLAVEGADSNRVAVYYESSGFKLVSNSFRESVMNISFDALKNNDDDTYVLSNEEIRTKVQSVLNLSINEFKIIPEQLLFSVNRLASKDVPLTLLSDIEYEVGFGSVDSIKIVPTTVKIIGPQKVIDSIEQLFTENIALSKAMSNISQTVSVDASNLPKGLTVTPNEVKIFQKVEKFTEGSIVVPVTLNDSDGRNIQLFPKEVTLFYTVPISKFDAVKTSDFVVEAISESDNSNESHLALAVTKMPNVVSETRLSLNQVQYVIVDE